MTALLEMKQSIKNFYGRYETYLLPVMKFVLAMIYFMWINNTLGFSGPLKSIFVVLIMALLCAILPTNSIVLFGFALIIGHCYALGIEIAGFALILIILMLILFLRFGAGVNLVMIFTPLGYMLRIPAAVPLSCGLLAKPLAVAPAACGVVLHYFLKLINEQASVLQSKDTQIPQKLQVILDGLLKNQEMWVTAAAFVVVILVVYLIRTRTMDYAWRIAVVVGPITYVVILLSGGLFMDIEISFASIIITAVVAMVLGVFLEFFAFGGDYTRTEHLEYEDDDYYYYVKAVPKAAVAVPLRQIKKINGAPVHSLEEENLPAGNNMPVSERMESPEVDVDFEKKLEESLKDL